MFYTIYKTTNIIDGKYYIGKHKTQNLDDNYLGSGKILKRAIKKHGIDNFTKEYLFIFDNEEDMNDKEAELVSEEFIKEDTNYNLKIGGEGGWDYINDNSLCPTWKKYNTTHKLPELGRQAHLYKFYNDELYREKFLKKLSKASLKARKTLSEKYPNGTFYGKSHTDKTKELMRKSKNIGKNNSQYGMMWIYSLELKVSKRISKSDDIPEGWYKGRKMKF